MKKNNQTELASARKNVSDKISVSATDWHALEVCSLRCRDATDRPEIVPPIEISEMPLNICFHESTQYANDSKSRNLKPRCPVLHNTRNVNWKL